jgi:glycosyltransferase involved in cell wall biosynthesis
MNTTMIKVGVLLQSNEEVGGIYQYCISIIEAAKNMNKKKFEPIFFYTESHWEKEIPKYAKKKKIYKYFFLKILRKVISLFKPSYKILKFFSSYLYEEVIIINKSDCDIVVMPSQNVASYLVSKKTLSSIHDLMHLYEKNTKEFKNGIFEMREFHYNALCKYSTSILVDSSMGKKHVINSYNVKKNKINILSYCAPTYLKKKFYFMPTLPKDYIFYPANFWHHKNHLRLIMAFRKVLYTKKDLNLVLCGSKKNGYEDILSLVKKLGIENKVFFLGRVPKEYMGTLYKNAKLTVFVSLFGPTNIPPLEAFTIGSPLVCSDVYAMKTQLKNASVFVDPHNYLSIARGINKILNNRDLKNNLISRGKKIARLKSQFFFNSNFEKIITKILNVK